ncbi:MAG: transporter [Moraxellaceae bacterium]|jgi:MFS family permease|nr:transporter [Moraxellaceae bacterium]
MRKTLVRVVALFASMALLIAGNGLLSTLLSVRLELEAFSTASIAIVLSIYSLGFIAGSLWLDRVIHRVGHIRSFAAFAALYSACILAFPLHVSVPGWIVLRVLTGFCIAGLTLVMESWLNGRATVENRGRLLATYMVVFFLAAALGQLLLRWGNPAELPLFSLAGILVALAVIPLALTRESAPEILPAPRLPLRELARQAPLGVAAAFTAGIVTSAFSGAGPIYAVRIGLPPETIAFFMAGPIVASMLIQPPVGWLSDRLPRKSVLSVTALVALAAALAIPLAGTLGYAPLAVTIALHVALASVLYPMSLAITHDALDAHHVIPANATLLLALGLGTVIGPLAAPVAMAVLGPSGLFLFIGGVLGLLVVVLMAMQRRQPTVPVAAQVHGVVLLPPGASPQATELDPRADAGDFEALHHNLEEVEDVARRA